MKRFLVPAILVFSACGTPPPPYRLPPPERQETPAPIVPDAPRPDPTLIPGDVVRISVFQQPELELETRVPENGIISYPLIGPVRATGGTTSDLERLILAKLQDGYLQKPSVSITVKEYAKRRIYIVGGVAKPDGYEMNPHSKLTVLQLIAAAGGLTDRAARDSVQVVRRQADGTRKVIPFSLSEAERQITKGHADRDPELWPDDLVVVPTAVRVAHVLGQVQRPGSIDLPANTRFTVSMAVSAAGSYTKFASTGSIQLLRHGPLGEVHPISVDLDTILDGRLDLDIEVLPGDVIWVPERGIFQ